MCDAPTLRSLAPGAGVVSLARSAALNEVPGAPSLSELAREAGTTYRCLRYWSAGDRAPRASSLAAVWAALRARLDLFSVADLRPGRTIHVLICPLTWHAIEVVDGVPDVGWHGVWPRGWREDELRAWLGERLGIDLSDDLCGAGTLCATGARAPIYCEVG